MNTWTRWYSVGMALLVIVLGGCVLFLYLANRSLTTDLAAIEDQVALLASAADESGNIQETLTDTVATAAPSVVSIVVSKDVPLLEVEYINPFGDAPFFRDADIRVPVYRYVGSRPERVGAGTGFLVREDGYIVTNRHVVNDPEASYTVLLADGTQEPATIIYRDDTYDLAVLKVAGTGYPALPLSDAVSVELGQTVIAIGNALGEYNNSVSVGIVSGLDRTIEALNAAGEIETLAGVIQTDAAINRGNSGGPLLNLDGEVIGVNVATTFGADNIAFAIPVQHVATVLERALP